MDGVGNEKTSPPTYIVTSEKQARKKILRAEAASGRHERDASIQEVFAGAEDLASALKVRNHRVPVCVKYYLSA